MKLLGLGLGKLLSGLALALSVTKDKESVVVNGSDKEEHLHPAKGRDGLDGGNTVRNGLEGDSRSNLSRELEHFRDDVSKDGKLGNTAVLQFSGSVLSEGLGVDAGGKTERIEKSNWWKDTKLGLNSS